MTEEDLQFLSQFEKLFSGEYVSECPELFSQSNLYYARRVPGGLVFYLGESMPHCFGPQSVYIPVDWNVVDKWREDNEEKQRPSERVVM